jgi:hypothetical protein
MKNIFTVLTSAALLTFSIGFTACGSSETEATTTEQTANQKDYQCPMKCEQDKVYHDAEATCPVCHMDLKEVAEG